MSDFTHEDLEKISAAIQKIGSQVLPFERTQFDRAIEQGEDMVDNLGNNIYVAVKGEYPPNYLTVPTEDIEAYTRDESETPNIQFAQYIWVIDESGIKMALDSTPSAPGTRRANICHSNLTGGSPAYIGGELWFDIQGTVYVNFLSGRYGRGTDDDQKEAAIEYFRVYYDNVIWLD